MNEPYGATPLDPDETRGLRFGHIETRTELDRMEQANIQDGMVWLGRQRNPDVLSEAFVRELHRRLFGQVWLWAGRFRCNEKNIGVAPEQVAVELRKLLGDCRFWVDNNTWRPIELALRFHHRLVWIHPFPNDNGRHARILADALLVHELGVRPIAWGGNGLLADSEHRNAYIESLRAADAGNFGPLLRLFGDGAG
ncbi:mobile mystery protein B [Spectribacter hydrogenoxidans]|uniref:Mobile mystery protein B n=1 Tax=Spectribacter hydrogenoxidans TaxID=3075608 RepID=A0ABU3C000_9GAMM|nr:mobile mystery protein B [Salinisphaera sp. W335]MDT0634850.1 mobile mystery protein B [Salinisphaera sp. W335]